MNLRYFESLMKKINEYDKKAKNPFFEIGYETNPFKSVFEKTYIWVTKK